MSNASNSARGRNAGSRRRWSIASKMPVGGLTARAAPRCRAPRAAPARATARMRCRRTRASAGRASARSSAARLPPSRARATRADPAGVQQPGDVVVTRDEQGRRVGEGCVRVQHGGRHVAVRRDDRRIRHPGVEIAGDGAQRRVGGEQPIGFTPLRSKHGVHLSRGQGSTASRHRSSRLLLQPEDAPHPRSYTPRMAERGGTAFPLDAASEAFEPIIGDWDTIGVHGMIPDTVLHGRASIDRLEPGGFLRIRSSIREDVGIPAGVAILGGDGNSGRYVLLHHDERGVTRIYDAALEGRVLRWWRDATGLRAAVQPHPGAGWAVHGRQGRALPGRVDLAPGPRPGLHARRVLARHAPRGAGRPAVLSRPPWYPAHVPRSGDARTRAPSIRWGYRILVTAGGLWLELPVTQDASGGRSGGRPLGGACSFSGLFGQGSDVPAARAASARGSGVCAADGSLLEWAASARRAGAWETPARRAGEESLAGRRHPDFTDGWCSLEGVSPASAGWVAAYPKQ